MKYIKDHRLEFNVYGSTIIGDFVKIENDSITIKTVSDFVVPVGEEQKIHKNHPHCVIEKK